MSGALMHLLQSSTSETHSQASSFSQGSHPSWIPSVHSRVHLGGHEPSDFYPTWFSRLGFTDSEPPSTTGQSQEIWKCQLLMEAALLLRGPLTPRRRLAFVLIIIY